MDKLGVGHLKISKYLAESDYYSNLKQLLMGQTQCIIRLYMISAYDLASRDNGGESDPYLVIKLGDKAYNDRANY
jgi:Ca2+-dependent lipid-binding protein